MPGVETARVSKTWLGDATGPMYQKTIKPLVMDDALDSEFLLKRWATMASSIGRAEILLIMNNMGQDNIETWRRGFRLGCSQDKPIDFDWDVTMAGVWTSDEGADNFRERCSVVVWEDEEEVHVHVCTPLPDMRTLVPKGDGS